MKVLLFFIFFMFLLSTLILFMLFFYLTDVLSRQSFFFMLYFFLICFSFFLIFNFSLNYSFVFIFLCIFFIFVLILIHEVFLLDVIISWLFVFIVPFLFFVMLLIIQFFDLLSVFFLLEIQNIIIFGFICFRSQVLESYRETVRFFFFSTFLSCFSMFGLSLIYFSTGTLDLSYLLHILYRFKYDAIFCLGNFLFFVNFFFKLSFFPFYIWLIYLFQATSLIGLFLQLVLVKFIVFFLLSTNLSFLFFFVDFLILPCGLLTLLFSIFSILYEYSIRGFFAFSSIIQTILLTFLLMSNSFDNFSSLFFCFFIYAINMFGIFLFLILFDRANVNTFSKIYNLFKTNSFVCFFLFLLLFSLAGIPPFPGFFQKYLILKTLFSLDFIFVFIFILFCSLVIGFYYLRFIVLILGNNVETLMHSFRLSSFSIRSLEFIIYIHLLSIFFLYDFLKWCYFFMLSFSQIIS